ERGVSRIQKRDAQGNWSVLTYGYAPGEVIGPRALAADTAGNLYVADGGDIGFNRIQMRDAQGSWSVIAPQGTDLGHVINSQALAMDTAGNLYVAEGDPYDGCDPIGIQERDAQGNWSWIGWGDIGPVLVPTALAVNTAGNLYVAAIPYVPYWGPIIGA